MSSFRKPVAAVGVAGLAISLVACASDQPTSVQLQQAPPTTQEAFLAKALPHGRRDLVWIGAVHNQAMHELVTTRKTWNDKSRGSRGERKCAAIADITTKYAAIVGQRLALGQSEVDEHVRNGLANVGCPGGKPGPAGKLQIKIANKRKMGSVMAIWRLAPVASPLLQEEEMTATGAYNDYVPAMESAIENASSGSEAAAGIDAVLSNAASAGLGVGDMTILQSIASVGASSSLYWYDYEASGQLDADIDEAREYETSIYRSMGWLKNFGFVGWSDLLGAATGVAAVCEWTGGGCVYVPKVALAGAVIGGIAGSAGAVLSLIYAT